MPLCRPLLNAKICSNHCLIVNFSGKNEISNVKPNANYYQSRSMKKGVSRKDLRSSELKYVLPQNLLREPNNV